MWASRHEDSKKSKDFCRQLSDQLAAFLFVIQCRVFRCFLNTVSAPFGARKILLFVRPFGDIDTTKPGKYDVELILRDENNNKTFFSLPLY